MVSHDETLFDPVSSEFSIDRSCEIPGFKFLNKIGHGGMGTVYRARDDSLGREVAIKVLQSQFAKNEEIAQRFLSEARITSQLQHPGIPAVHMVGSLTDGRPFLVMKLIKGCTLDEALASRDGDVVPGQYLAVFESVCQAVAYAHSHRVIHRDLKPSNVMVGAFGEVQVMDWGLAKILNECEPKTDFLPADTEVLAATVSATAFDSPGLFTQAGRFLGTPAFVPPEQAAGELEKVDTRADVFGLGAMLTVILTGHAPYRGKSLDVLTVQAIRGDLTDCMTRLDTCGADPEWIALCKRCLSVDPNNRPRDAGAVADAAARLRSAAEQRAKQAELDRVRADGARKAAEIEARVQRQRRRMQGVLGIMFTTVVCLGGLFAWRYQEQRRIQEEGERNRTLAVRAEVNRLTQEAESTFNRASVSERDLGLWAEARAAAKQAAVRAASNDVSAEVREKISKLVDTIEQAEKSRKLVETLLEIRMSGSDTLMADGWMNSRAVADRYQNAFEQYGVDILAMPASDASKLLIQLAGKDRVELAAAIDDWSFVRHDQEGKFGELFPISRLIDPDPTRNRIRELVSRQSHDELCAYADTIDPGKHLPQTVNLISLYLYGMKPGGDSESAKKFLRRAQPHHPGDFFINKNLAWCMDDAPDALAYWTAAIAIRPRSPSAWQGLAFILRQQGKLAEAEKAVRRVHALAPNIAAISRGNDHFARGEHKAAVQAFREAVEIAPTDHGAHRRLGMALRAMGDLDAAEQSFRIGMRLLPGDSHNFLELAVTLNQRGRREDANTYVREVHTLSKKDPAACRGRAAEFLEGNFPEAAISLAQAALVHNPKDAIALAQIGSAYLQQQDYPKSISALNQSLESDANNELALRQLAWILATGPDGVRDGKRAVDLALRLCDKHGKHPKNLESLAAAYAESNKFDKAIEVQQKTLELGTPAKLRLDLYRNKKPYRAVSSSK